MLRALKLSLDDVTDILAESDASPDVEGIETCLHFFPFQGIMSDESPDVEGIETPASKTPRTPE